MISSETGNYGFRFLEGSCAPLIALMDIGLEKRESASYYFENTHRPSCYLFQYTLSGSGTLVTDGCTHIITAGQAFFLSMPGDEKYFFDPHVNQPPWHFLYIMFYGHSLDSLYRRVIDAKGPVLTLNDHGNCIQTLFHVYRNAQRGSITDAFLASALAYEFLCALCSECVCPPQAPRGLSFLACQLIESEFARLDGVEDIARRLSVTPSHLSRVFSHDMGTTPIAYLTHKRLERAVELVYAGGYTNDEIAHACGFSNGNYLCKLFRRYLGASPRELKAQRYHSKYTHITLY